MVVHKISHDETGRALDDAMGKYHQAVGHVLVVGAFLIGMLCVAAEGRKAMCDNVRRLELRAYQLYAAGDLRGCLNACLDLQKADPDNARRLYLSGLCANKAGNDGRPLITEAARLGDGMAESWLKGDSCTTATGTGTGPTGK